MKTYFTSESVTRGHPDKICDQIADRILDEILIYDPDAHVACEVTCTTDQVHIFGEITTTARVDYEEIARQVIREIGYTEQGRGFDADTCKIYVNLHEQSPDIAKCVIRKQDELDMGAGDQGMMFGFACRDTECFMPLPIELAHALTKRLEQVRKTGDLPYLLPDGKAQVTVQYRNGIPARVAAIVLSCQHREEAKTETLRNDVLNRVIYPALPEELIDDDTQIFINPGGRFVIGGPAADSGLTGRKTIVDTYGGFSRFGGGALSGKDASKVDRSGAYMARYLAKNIVAAGLADKCEVQLSYAIGLTEPISVMVDTFGTGKVSDEELCNYIIHNIDLRPAVIIRKFGLNNPIFSKVSCYGHFGSNAINMPWERVDLAETLRRNLS
ncbi:S-adenosylmethionine synthase MetK [Thermoclostridium stercorarium subsp. stercorarium DSM 8532]|jgi:S-adenosylmethionine synthetase|uniref:S-adenosylmethionine synthase n=3 Tax=Thermoclostridium stercorarium TaxID=1510 RepID=L7VR89_THES1|nr:methionine adenosyltransferase [Thermoclostridium stercorarium]AGC69297.1 S-adenosylmethionine synthase MetK [Thermoclostridium stercorarium subsp. stercorarium DSM 8532]AGI40261.1 methionine adenosyltransferase [Thermoclostridium stercorarium subsp. stercorarium DSM 8532]ANW99561.1 methionine adenosyltransferase [Thermoclostridium stercorarium subsp. thermolacticum DSM 2910]ANX02191.1 methionine adenosyltransferase [Thermoclostridium stercorarium subsp. leptospartum DSM 9219]UZQ85265.1 met